MNILDRRPLPAQLHDRILALVQEENYRPGEKLPSEQEFATRFGVSRITVREALKRLEEERLILCRHGVGRFVSPELSGILSEALTDLKSVQQMAKELAIPLQTRVLKVQEELPEERVRNALNLETGNSVVVVERVRLSGDQPVIYSIDIFPRRMMTGNIDEIDYSESLLQVMEKSWSTRLVYAKAVLSAEVLPEDVSRRIGMERCEAWIRLEQVNYDTADKPMLFSIDYHRGDKFQFHVLRRRR